MSQPYEVMREYKVFRKDDPKPVSVVTVQIKFTPPDNKTFEITKTEGSPRGKKIVNTILEQETASAKSHRGDISRSNYDFAFCESKTLARCQSMCCTSFPNARKRACF